MRNIDVSVVLNMHREALYLRPTLLSLEACAAEAAKIGIKVELVAVFDRADQDTLAVFHQTPLLAFEKIKVTEIDVGSLGLARNAGIDLAEGEFVWTSDGDDLVSRNSIIELFKTARNYPRSKVAVFLDYLAAFGEQYHVARYVGSQWLTAADFAYKHPYVSRIFIRRSAFESQCYLDLKVTTGFAYEDWDFNTRLFAAGFEFSIAPNTILFYRQRGNSLLRQANATSAKMIPHSSLFEPVVYRAAMASAREKNPDWPAFIQARQQFFERNFAQELMAVEPLVGYVVEATKLDPEVQSSRIETAGSYSPISWNPNHWGFQLDRFFQLLPAGESFTDILLLPWLKPGGAEKYILQVLHKLCTLGGCRRLLVLSGETASRHEWTRLLPKGTIFIDVFNTFPMLEDAERSSMLVRALLAVASQGARLHIKSCSFSHSLMDLYGSVLSSNFKVIYYRFCDDTYFWRNERLSGSWGIGFLRRQLSNIDLLISDCYKIISRDCGHLGAQSEKYRVIYAQCALHDPTVTKRLPRKRLLWASRISAQKRPELVLRIATALLREYPEMVVEVYGQTEENYQQLLFNVPGVEYCGSFDGFDSLPIERFDAFVYTSIFDGLPNVILEALGAGLPVIAPNVGGIEEAVIEGDTGFLVPDLVDEDALIEAYVDAVRRLYSDWDCTMKIAERGRRLIAERHCEANFRQRVVEVFELELDSEEVCQ